MVNRNGLTEKQQAFCDAYVENPTERTNFKALADRAGISKATALKYIKEEEVQDYLTPILQAEQKLRIMGKDEVLMNISDIAGNLYIPPPTRLKALEMMGKYYALFTEKTEFDFGRKTMERLTDMSMEERKERLDQLIGSFHDGSE